MFRKGGRLSEDCNARSRCAGVRSTDPDPPPQPLNMVPGDVLLACKRRVYIEDGVKLCMLALSSSISSGGAARKEMRDM